VHNKQSITQYDEIDDTINMCNLEEFYTTINGALRNKLIVLGAASLIDTKNRTIYSVSVKKVENTQKIAQRTPVTGYKLISCETIERTIFKDKTDSNERCQLRYERI